MGIKDKVIIVTGASSGIGLATAKLLSKNGAKLMLVARSKDKIEKLAKELKNSISIQTDMSKENQVREMVKKAKGYFGRIDILINNAGRGYDALIENTDPEKYRDIFNLNVIGTLVAMQAVIPIMRRQGGGAIVNISSGTALMHLPGMSAYSSTKRSIAVMSQIAREELKKDKIIVSVVYPYITDTDFEKNTIKEIENSMEEENGDLPPVDSAEYVAEKILEVIKSGKAEQLAHDWMKKLH